MSTADEVRRDMWRGYWRLRQQQQLIQREFIEPLAKLAMERVLEIYPELKHTGSDGQ